MADLGKNLKSIWMKSMEAIGNTASNIASNTKYKVDEMNLLNRRREILSDFGAKAYAMWQKGEFTGLPDSLKQDLEELTRLDNQLVDMRAEHFGGEDTVASELPDGNNSSEETGDEENDVPANEAEAPDSEPGQEQSEQDADTQAPVVSERPDVTADNSAEPLPKTSTITEAINNLFDDTPSVNTMAEKMNDTLDQMNNHLKKFSEEMDKQLKDLNESITGTDDESAMKE